MADEQPDTSVSQFLAVFIPNIIIFLAFVVVFLLLRKKQRRVYEARAAVETVPADLKPAPAPLGPVSWLRRLYIEPEHYVIQYTGVDGYFFLRFIALFTTITFIGCLVLWPILFPISIANGYTKLSLNMFSFGNIKDKWRYFAHVFLSWLYFGSVIAIIYRELRYFTTFRHALAATPFYLTLLLSRTLFFCELDSSLLLVSELKRHFPLADNVWFARDYKKLDKLVEEREKLSKKYENTLNKLIVKAKKTLDKALKKKTPIPDPANDIEQYIKKRPTHRLKFLIGKKVDTLKYCPERIGELNKLIKEKQDARQDYDQLPAAFVEFSSSYEAQRAYQGVLQATNKLKGVRCIPNVSPDDVIWSNLNLTGAKRHLQRILANTFLLLLIIFWCIPVAVVGAISNINTLTTLVPFLKFINNMPSSIMGIITGLLPVVALAVLMLLVPPIIRLMGRIGGLLTVQHVELYTQQWFYGFLVVNGFLVMTLASAATLAVPTIIKDPLTVLLLLAINLPKSANFYLAYICLQGLALSSGLLAQVVAVILAQVLGRILDATPRQKWTRWTTLAMPLWLTMYPLIQLLAVIALCYAFINPLVLGFAFVAFCLFHVAYLYTLVYVMRPQVADARGRNYASSLLQLFVGIYLAESCLVALFVFSKNWACVVLEALMLAATVVSHVWLKRMFLPVFDTVPLPILKNLAGPTEAFDLGKKECAQEGKRFWNDKGDPSSSGSSDGAQDPAVAAASASAAPPNLAPDTFRDSRDDALRAGAASYDNEKQTMVGNNNNRSATGLDGLKSLFRPHADLLVATRAKMPEYYDSRFEYNESFLHTAYDSPSVNALDPQIWIARDPMGLLQLFKEHAQTEGVNVLDENAVLNDKGKAEYTSAPPLYEPPLRV